VRFLLLLSPTRGGDCSPAGLGRRIASFAEWVARARRDGVIQAGAPLAPRWARLRRDGNGTSAAERDGLAADAVASYLVIEAPDLEAALRIATSCPAADPGTLAVFQEERDEPVRSATSDAVGRG
jgi:hypothetical protein